MAEFQTLRTGLPESCYGAWEHPAALQMITGWRANSGAVSSGDLSRASNYINRFEGLFRANPFQDEKRASRHLGSLIFRFHPPATMNMQTGYLIRSKSGARGLPTTAQGPRGLEAVRGRPQSESPLLCLTSPLGPSSHSIASTLRLPNPVLLQG